MIPSVVGMTQTQLTTTTDTCSGHRGNDRTLALVTTASAGLACLAWRAGGVHLTVTSGSGTFEVGLIGVLVTAAVVSVVGLGLLRLLERRGTHGVQAWTAIALFVLVASLLGPLGATTLPAGFALVSLHLVVGTSLVVGARRSRRCGVA
jgi:hypothetical protein